MRTLHLPLPCHRMFLHPMEVFSGHIRTCCHGIYLPNVKWPSNTNLLDLFNDKNIARWTEINNNLHPTRRERRLVLLVNHSINFILFSIYQNSRNQVNLNNQRTEWNQQETTTPHPVTLRKTSQRHNHVIHPSTRKMALIHKNFTKTLTYDITIGMGAIFINRRRCKRILFYCLTCRLIHKRWFTATILVSANNRRFRFIHLRIVIFASTNPCIVVQPGSSSLRCLPFYRNCLQPIHQRPCQN